MSQTTSTSPQDQAVKLYQNYVGQLENGHTKLVGSIQKFLGSVRKKTEEADKIEEEKLLSHLDRKLKKMDE